MSIWRVGPDMEVSLVDWKVFEVSDGTRHFVGWDPLGYQGRVSSAIQSWDEKTNTGTTKSGRMYSLLGPSRNHPDASYVWNRWKGINSISEEIIDVSEEYSGGEGVDEYR